MGDLHRSPYCNTSPGGPRAYPPPACSPARAPLKFYVWSTIDPFFSLASDTVRPDSCKTDFCRRALLTVPPL